MAEDVFARLEVRREDILATKTAKAWEEETGPMKIKLPKGTAPTAIEMKPIYRLAWKLMGKFAVKVWQRKPDENLELALLQAHMDLREPEYLAYVYFMTLIALIVGLVFGGTIGVLLYTLTGIAIFVAFAPIIPLMMAMGTYFIIKSSPSSKAKARKKNIDAHLPSAMNLIAAMASADVTLDVIFKELARRKEDYGEVATEAEWITRDTELLGKDILTATQEAAKRSPSLKWQEFLQGVVTTATSGGRLKPYFMAKSEEYEKEAKLMLRNVTETLGLFSEIYVIVGVAFPLFFVVIMAIFSIISQNAGGNVMFLQVFVYLIMPILIAVFTFFIYSTSREVNL